MATVPVPPLIGQVRGAAIAALTQAGLVGGSEASVVRPAPLSPVNLAIPLAGTQLRSGTRVDLEI